MFLFFIPTVNRVYHFTDTDVASVIVVIVRMKNLVSINDLLLNVIPKVNQFVSTFVKVVDMLMRF